MFNFSHPETLTQAYHAGIIVAQVENFLPKENIPTLGVCMVNFHALRELFGERLWQKLKSRRIFKKRVDLYDRLTYQPFLPREMIGTSREFCVGYVKSYSLSRTKRKTDKKTMLVAGTIVSHVEETLLIG